MKMLQMICGKILKDVISNEKNLGNDRCRENKEVLERTKIAMIWEHMDNERPPVKAKKFVVDGPKKGRLKKR